VVDVGPVLVDYRERGSSIPDVLIAAGLEVQLTDLPVGDYVLGPGLAVERKGPNDLGASIRDGRIFDQAVRLQSAFAQAVLMLEAEPRGIAEDAWRGAVCRWSRTGSPCWTVWTSRTVRPGSFGSPSVPAACTDQARRWPASRTPPPVRAG
jgi:DNA excision repair protein ERCC-4